MKKELFLIVLVLIYLDSTIQLKLNKHFRKDYSLKDIWRPVEYLLPINQDEFDDKQFSKEDWIQEYKQFFSVPDWLALQKFQWCDDNNDGIILGQQMICF